MGARTVVLVLLSETRVEIDSTERVRSLKIEMDLSSGRTSARSGGPEGLSVVLLDMLVGCWFGRRSCGCWLEG